MTSYWNSLLSLSHEQNVGNLIKAICSFWVAIMAFNWLNRNWEKYSLLNSWCRRNKLKLACDFKSLSRNVLLQTVWLTPSPPTQVDRFFFFIWFIDSSVSIVTGIINTLSLVVRHYKKENKNKKARTSTIVMSDSCDVLMTCIVFSQHRLNTPSTPVSPMPSTKSRVKRNGTVSGVGRNLPCSNATPMIIDRQTRLVLRVSDRRNIWLQIKPSKCGC